MNKWYLLFGLLICAFLWKPTLAQTNGTIPVVGQPTAEWCASTHPWVLDGSFKLPEDDPCFGTAKYMVSIQGVDHPNQSWAGVKVLTQNGAVYSSIWRIPLPVELPIGNPPPGWEEGSESWNTDGTFILPNQDPFTTNANYDVVIQTVKTKGLTYQQAHALLDGGLKAGSLWRIPQQVTNKPVGSPDVGWENGTAPWVLDGNFQLPDNDPANGTSNYLVTVEGVDHHVDTWKEVVNLTKDGMVPSSIWRTDINFPIYLPLISR